MCMRMEKERDQDTTFLEACPEFFFRNDMSTAIVTVTRSIKVNCKKKSQAAMPKQLFETEIHAAQEEMRSFQEKKKR